MDLDPRRLRHFLAVASELHFGRAAGRLYVSQSALSESIKKLERDLGVTLFLRGTRRVELTEAGKVLQIQAPEILRQIDDAAAHVLAAARENSRHFRFGYSPFLDLNRIDRIRAQVERLSDWNVESVSERTTELIRLLLIGELSAALIIGPLQERSIAWSVLFREGLQVGLPTTHPLAASATIRFADVAEENVIWLPRSFNPAYYDWFVQACEKHQYRPRFAFSVTTVQECVHLIESGKGITFMTRSAQSLARLGVVFRPLAERILVETLLAHSKGAVSSFMNRFADIATAAFEDA